LSNIQFGQVFAAGSEDMDTLTFNAPTLYRHLTFSEAKKQPICEINLQAALDGLGMNMDQVGTFRDMKRELFITQNPSLLISVFFWDVTI